MSRFRGNYSICPFCGIRYKDFRCTVYQFYQEVVDSLWVGSENPEDWRYKRKGTILGVWFSAKQKEWKEHLENCRKIELETLEDVEEY